MPNISFDIFYNTDLVNFTISRTGGAPRAKPDWKVRQAPKLGPKPKPTPENTFGRKTAPTQPRKELPEGTKEIEEVQSEAGENVKRTPPKLQQQTKKKQEGGQNEQGEQKKQQEKKRSPPKLKNQANGAANKSASKPSWIAGIISNGVQTAIQPGVASAGSFAGGAVSSVGNGVNSAGESLNSYIRRYGTGIQDYGNAIRDWAAADGPRAQTASNPLGLSSTAVGGKMGVTNPRLPVALPRSSSTPAAPQRQKIEAAKKSGTQKANSSAARAPSRIASTIGGKGSGVSAAKGTNTNKVKISAASKPQNLGKAKSLSAKSSGIAAGASKPAVGSKQKGGVNHLYMGG